ncbi:MAG: Gfo/Idh/MocA family oxidoreductase [Erysipelotrichaceae bacterium]|nr:Gfo/Idh/MocA family oxidoreductase [Erysipelotrichaceae bacterium]
MKLAILGIGKIFDMIIPFYPSLNIEKTYLLSTVRSYEKAQELVERYGFAGVYTDYDKMLNEADIDSVYIALPNHLHYDYALKAIKAHKHVLCEKPITANEKEYQELEKLAHEAGVYFVEAMMIHYMPIIEKLKQSLKDIGKHQLAILNFTQYSSRYDAFLRGEILPAFDPQKCGGALYDINVYNLHLALYLFGIPDSYYYEPAIERGIDTHGVLTLNYPDGFKVICIGAKDCNGTSQSEIIGTKGMIHYAGPPGIMTNYTVETKEKLETITEKVDYTHRYEFDAFINMVNHHQDNRVAEMMCLSKNASIIMAECRYAKGIVFGNDGKEI